MRCTRPSRSTLRSPSARDTRTSAGATSGFRVSDLAAALQPNYLVCMANYAVLVLKTAFARWAPRTDLASGVLGGLVPCAYVLSGRPVPDNVTLLIAEIAVGIIVGWVTIRLVAAPYLIWKQDQAEIVRLSAQLDEPGRKGQAAIMASLSEERVKLIKKLTTILGDLRERNSMQRNAEESARILYAIASPFLFNPDFKFYWFTFEKNMKALAALRAYQGTNKSTTIQSQSRILNRFVYHSILVEASIYGMIEWLAFGEQHRKAFDSLYDTVKTNCREVDFSFAMPSQINFNEISDSS